jgi:hypothetical protein
VQRRFRCSKAGRGSARCAASTELAGVLKNGVELRFALRVVAFLREAVIGADAGKGLPRRGDARFIALNDDFLIFTVVHHRGGKLRERAVGYLKIAALRSSTSALSCATLVIIATTSDGKPSIH